MGARHNGQRIPHRMYGSLTLVGAGLSFRAGAAVAGQVLVVVGQVCVQAVCRDTERGGDVDLERACAARNRAADGFFVGVSGCFLGKALGRVECCPACVGCGLLRVGHSAVFSCGKVGLILVRCGSAGAASQHEGHTQFAHDVLGGGVSALLCADLLSFRFDCCVVFLGAFPSPAADSLFGWFSRGGNHVSAVDARGGVGAAHVVLPRFGRVFSLLAGALVLTRGTAKWSLSLVSYPGLGLRENGLLVAVAV